MKQKTVFGNSIIMYVVRNEKISDDEQNKN